MTDGRTIPGDYMEPAEEWEREGLLDPAWEKQQKKVSVSALCKFNVINLGIVDISLL
jgi:hypothetical protein